jgi:probable HAF family extracellular repeat protein
MEAARRPFLASVLVALPLVCAPHAHAQYAPSKLGSLPGTSSSYAVDVNARGEAVGGSGSGFGTAVLWSAGRIIPIGSLDGTSGQSVAAALNDRGQVVGRSRADSGDLHGFLYYGGALTDLGTLPGHHGSQAADINERGDIAGISYRYGEAPHAVLWADGAIHDLGAMPVGEGTVLALNERRQIVGYSSTLLETRGWIWQDGVFTLLPLPPGANYSFAWAINDRGDIVGAVSGEWTRAVLWPATGGVVELGVLAGDLHSWARAINNRGQIVGSSTATDGTSRAFLWRAGTMIDLGPLPGGTSAVASAINDGGTIVGQSTDQPAGFGHATVWRLTARSR